MPAKTSHPPTVHLYVSDRERRRRIRLRRRRRLAMSAVALAAVAGVVATTVWALTRGGSVQPPGQAVVAVTAKPSSAPGTALSAAQSPSPSASASPSTAPTIIELGWVGDTTPGSKYGLPPDEGRALFASMRRRLSKPDLMIANLEGTYSTPGPSKCDGASSGACYAFQAPPSYAKALAWSGIDLVNVANNHSYDYLPRGFLQTQKALTGVGVAFAGRPGKVTMLTVRGVRVGVMGFSPYSWSENLNDIPAATRLVRRAAAKADVVVVLMHAGAEGADKTHTPKGSEYAFGENRGDSRAFAHAVVDAGADLVLGSGPHVIRGIERYKDRLIAYSLGNFAGWGNFGVGGNLSLSGLLTVRIDAAGRIHGGRWLSVYLAAPGVPEADGSNASLKLVRSLSAADFEHTYRLDSKGYFKVRTSTR